MTFPAPEARHLIVVRHVLEKGPRHLAGVYLDNTTYRVTLCGVPVWGTMSGRRHIKEFDCKKCAEALARGFTLDEMKDF